MEFARILLVEDDRPLCASLKQLLLVSGYAVTSFFDSPSVLSYLQQHPDLDDGRTLVLVDVHLQGHNGIDIQEVVRGAGSALPFVFMSAHQDAGDVNRAWRAGAHNFLFKPFTPKDLLDAIEAALRAHRPRDLLGSPDAPAATPTDPKLVLMFKRLTARQKQVLRLVASGLSNASIASQLQISVRTVKMHRELVMHRCGFAHISELVRFYDACKHLF